MPKNLNSFSPFVSSPKVGQREFKRNGKFWRRTYQVSSNFIIMTSLGVIFVGQRNFFSLRGPVLSVLTNVCTKLYCSHWKKKLVRENNSIV